MCEAVWQMLARGHVCLPHGMFGPPIKGWTLDKSNRLRLGSYMLVDDNRLLQKQLINNVL